MMKRIGKYFYQFAGVGLLLWLIWGIGINAIWDAVSNVSVTSLVLLCFIGVLSLCLRMIKVSLLNSNLTWRDSSEIALISRIGAQISMFLSIAPVAQKRFRQASVLNGLLVDRVLEVLATLVIALLFSLLLIFKHDWIGVFSAIFSFQIIVFFLFLRVKIRKFSRFNIVHKIVEQLDRFTSTFLKEKKLLLRLSALTFVATLCDFLCVFIVFGALGVEFHFGYIPIIWAVSSTVGMITFLNVGPSEISWVYLFTTLVNVSSVYTSAMILITRFFDIVVLLMTYIGIAIVKSLSEERIKPVLTSPSDNGI
ncbi:lysylphosphatidylglycerol synthase domain-containing protein [Teredinibacter sp. KSP-S5-2]|uniref:lysylphosphatidylglycerol synthase domain-containing protein n=1 Tax=Teredinibacter sp. KSP-S5-2 TaxID=3034506 RepID=UPI00293420EB|nr:lysylphosphatidylglycerol synthase domain-containing protein [Teredinibacter sp. KSP-S5-2]WNO10649.1 lysylphosphatidylglycerol synthase domain-containing protein [Teredinibacter sp. KSP-S5-2]